MPALDAYCDPALAAAFEGAEAVACRQFCQAAAALYPGVRWLHRAGGAALFYGPSDPINAVKGAGLSGPVDPTEWSEVESLYFESRSPVTIDLCPLADPAFFNFLIASGYKLAAYETVTFRRIDASVAADIPADLRISTVDPRDESAVNNWERALNVGFANGGVPAQFVVNFGRVRAHTVLSGINPHSYMILATVNSEPAGGAALTIARAVPTAALPKPPLIALMSGAAVLPAFRNRGIQQALTAARLDLARRHGAAFATIVVLAGSSSHRNACRAGFITAYSRPQLTREAPAH